MDHSFLIWRCFFCIQYHTSHAILFTEWFSIIYAFVRNELFTWLSDDTQVRLQWSHPCRTMLKNSFVSTWKITSLDITNAINRFYKFNTNLMKIKHKQNNETHKDTQNLFKDSLFFAVQYTSTVKYLNDKYTYCICIVRITWQGNNLWTYYN